MKFKDKLILMGIVFIINYLLDRVTKILAFEFLGKTGQSYHYLGNLIVLRYIENEGAFLGMGGDFHPVTKLILLIIVPLIFLILALLYSLFKENNKIAIICLTSVVAGGLANIQDRLFNDGKVIDFLNFGIGNLRTGILNVADMSITFGAIIYIAYEFYRAKKLKDTKNEDNTQ